MSWLKWEEGTESEQVYFPTRLRDSDEQPKLGTTGPEWDCCATFFSRTAGNPALEPVGMSRVLLNYCLKTLPRVGKADPVTGWALHSWWFGTAEYIVPLNGLGGRSLNGPASCFSLQWFPSSNSRNLYLRLYIGQ